MKTIQELRKLDPKKLMEELELLSKELFKIKFEIRTGQAKNNHEIEKNKKQIARIKTILQSADYSNNKEPITQDQQ